MRWNAKKEVFKNALNKPFDEKLIVINEKLFPIFTCPECENEFSTESNIITNGGL